MKMWILGTIYGASISDILSAHEQFFHDKVSTRMLHEFLKWKITY